MGLSRCQYNGLNEDVWLFFQNAPRVPIDLNCVSIGLLQETAALHRDIRVAGYSLVSSTVMHLKDSDQARSAANVVAILKVRLPFDNALITRIHCPIKLLRNKTCISELDTLQYETWCWSGNSKCNWQHLLFDDLRCLFETQKPRIGCEQTVPLNKYI